jgi:hypothetical protein
MLAQFMGWKTINIYITKALMTKNTFGYLECTMNFFIIHRYCNWKRIPKDKYKLQGSRWHTHGTKWTISMLEASTYFWTLTWLIYHFVVHPTQKACVQLEIEQLYGQQTSEEKSWSPLCWMSWAYRYIRI